MPQPKQPPRRVGVPTPAAVPTGRATAGPNTVAKKSAAAGTTTVRSLSVLRLLIYGFSGSGKSHLLTSVLNCPELLPATVISVDGGAETLRRRLSSAGEAVKLVEAVSPAEIEQALKTALTDPQVKTILIDGLRNIYDVVLGAINPVMPEGMMLPRSITDWSDNSQRDRGIVLQVVSQLLDTLVRQTTKHFIATCLAEEAVDSDGKPTGQLSVAMAGRLKRLVPSYFSMTGYLGVERVRKPKPGGGTQTTSERVLVLVPTFKFPEVKTRYADADSPEAADIVDPTMSRILDRSIRLYATK